MVFKVWPYCWSSLVSPPPPFSSVQSPPPGELTWKDLYLGPILVADWPGEGTLPQGFTTNGDSAAWLIGRGQVASLHFSFFCFNQQPLHCLSPPHLQLCFVTVERCGAGLSTSLGTIVLLWTRLGLFPVSPFAADSSLGCWDQHLVGCYYGPCHPNPVSLRSVTDTSPLHMLPVLSFFLSVLKEKYTFYMNKHK